MNQNASQSNEWTLTPMQQGMLFHALRDEAEGVEILQIVGRLKEEIDTQRLIQIWSQLESEHLALRLGIHWRDRPSPVQKETQSAHSLVRQFDWRDQPTFEQDRSLKAFIQADRVTGFSLDEAPLSRLTLIRLADAEYAFLWTHHHIILDGRSQLLILRELFERYDQDHTSGPKNTERSQFSRHIEWLSEQDPTTSDKFWQGYLAEFQATPTLPMSTTAGHDRGVGMLEEFEIQLSLDESDRIRDLVQLQDLSVPSLFETLWGLLLARHADRSDLVIGITRAGRYGTVEDSDQIIGNLINSLPFRIRIEQDMPVGAWLKRCRQDLLSIRNHEHSSLMRIQNRLSPNQSTGLFDSLVICDHYRLEEEIHRLGGAWLKRDFRLLDQTPFLLNLYVYNERKIVLKIAFNNGHYSATDAQSFLSQLTNLALGAAANPSLPLKDLTLATKSQRKSLANSSQGAITPFDLDQSITDLIDEQAHKSPARVALVFEDQELTYADLIHRSNVLAADLIGMGVGTEDRVGVCVGRSIEMVIGLLSVLKTGAAYVPLDPEFPSDRLQFMVQDSGIKIIVGDPALSQAWQESNCHFLPIPSVEGGEDSPSVNIGCRATGESIAYVLYTSGSTGRPKGVEVRHRNVVNFFVGMDAHVKHDESSVWLAVTSMSFDISVLELFWTLARGLKVVVLSEKLDTTVTSSSPPDKLSRALSFSLFFFGGAQDGEEDSYRLLLDAARFADDNGFEAVWTPERHFDAFGGIFPNPSLTGAALAAITKNVDIRAGSVVLPLQDPLRVAEEWAVVDQLSHGRAGIALASGWHARDFALQPHIYERRHAFLFENIQTLRDLWRGETVERETGTGDFVPIEIHPRPRSQEIPIWVTSGGNRETMESAGTHGANLLTHMLGQNLSDLSDKIAAYRRAFSSQSDQNNEGHVTMMLHTFLGEDLEKTHNQVREPLVEYLKTSSNLVMNLAKGMGDGELPNEDDMETFLHSRFDRYVGDTGLLGTQKSCWPTLQKLADIGVDELACFIDFGLPYESVMASLKQVAQLATECRHRVATRPSDFSAAAMIKRHGVTHLQCTPSLMGIWLADGKVANSLSNLKQILIGGEAFPEKLARDLQAKTSADVINMYGPTETTIWSSCYHLEAKHSGEVPIGKPLLNTQLYVLDENHNLQPDGVPGELYIGGEGVAAGYLGRQELTSSKFVCITFENGIERLVYRTGDRVRRRMSQCLEFLGRVDDQIKIRGHRIEPGEIEEKVRDFDGVDDVVVAASQSADSSYQLTLWYTSDGGSPIDPNRVRTHLRSRVPEAMVPTFIVKLDAFPLTPNKKIDRKNLPKPEQMELSASETSRQPHVGTESDLAELWRRVLSRDTILADDNFFDVGGHSLSAIQLLSEVNERFGIAMSLSHLFDHPTLADLALAIEEVRFAAASQDAVGSILHDMLDGGGNSND